MSVTSKDVQSLINELVSYSSESNKPSMVSSVQKTEDELSKKPLRIDNKDLNEFFNQLSLEELLSLYKDTKFGSKLPPEFLTYIRKNRLSYDLLQHRTELFFKKIKTFKPNYSIQFEFDGKPINIPVYDLRTDDDYLFCIHTPRSDLKSLSSILTEGKLPFMDETPYLSCSVLNNETRPFSGVATNARHNRIFPIQLVLSVPASSVGSVSPGDVYTPDSTYQMRPEKLILEKQKALKEKIIKNWHLSLLQAHLQMNLPIPTPPFHTESSIQEEAKKIEGFGSNPLHSVDSLQRLTTPHREEGKLIPSYNELLIIGNNPKFNPNTSVKPSQRVEIKGVIVEEFFLQRWLEGKPGEQSRKTSLEKYKISNPEKFQEVIACLNLIQNSHIPILLVRSKPNQRFKQQVLDLKERWDACQKNDMDLQSFYEEAKYLSELAFGNVEEKNKRIKDARETAVKLTEQNKPRLFAQKEQSTKEEGDLLKKSEKSEPEKPTKK